MSYLNNFIFLFCLGVILAFLIPYNIPLLSILLIMILLFLLSFYNLKIRYLLFFLIGVAYTLYSFNEYKHFEFNKFYKNTRILIVGNIKNKKLNTGFSAKILDKNIPIEKVILSDYLKRDWHIGQIWEVSLKLKPPIGIVNNIGFNLEYWSLANSIDAYGNLGKYRKLISYNMSNIDKLIINWQNLRNKAKARIYKVAGLYTDAASLICALVLGDTSGISVNNMQIFKKLGLVHLISISGLHIGMVAYFISIVLYLLFKLLIFLKINLVPNNLKICIVILSCIGAFIYSLFAGFSTPAQRSIFMLIALSIFILNRSYTNIWQILMLSLFGVLIYNPKSILVPGFWLSFLFVAILVFSNYGFLNNSSNNVKIINFFRSQFSVTLMSIILIGFFFGNFPILSPLVNLIAIPWFSLVLTPLSLICIILPWDFLLNILILLSQITLKVLSFLSIYSFYLTINKIPFIFLILAIIAVLILTLPIGTGLKAWASCIIICFIFFPKAKIKNGNIKINVFDVGSGLSLLIQTYKHNILYGTGKAIIAQDIISNLNYLGVQSLDMLILFNNNSVNDSGFDIINNNIQINKIFAGQPYRYIQDNIFYCKDEISWYWDNVYFEFLTPNTFLKTKKNDDASCVLKILTEHEAVIIVGNLSIKGQNDLIEKYWQFLHSQILILGNRKKNFLSDIFLNYVNPEYIIFSLGLNNNFIDDITNKEITILRTDLTGQIEMDIKENDIKVTPVKNFKKFWQKKP